MLAKIFKNNFFSTKQFNLYFLWLYLVIFVSGYLLFKDFCENVSEEPVPQLRFYEEVSFNFKFTQDLLLILTIKFLMFRTHVCTIHKRCFNVTFQTLKIIFKPWFFFIKASAIYKIALIRKAICFAYYFLWLLLYTYFNQVVFENSLCF